MPLIMPMGIITITDTPATTIMTAIITDTNITADTPDITMTMLMNIITGTITEMLSQAEPF